MKRAIGTIILLAASGAGMLPALAADRDQRSSDWAYQSERQAKYGSNHHNAVNRLVPEVRQGDHERGRDVRSRNERYRHEREDWRYRFQRERNARW